MKKLIVLSMLLSAPLFAMEYDLGSAYEGGSIGQDLYASTTTQFPNATQGWYGNGGESTWSDTNMPAPAWGNGSSSSSSSSTSTTASSTQQMSTDTASK